MKLHERGRSPSFPFSVVSFTFVPFLWWFVVFLFLMTVCTVQLMCFFVPVCSMPWLARLTGNWEKLRRHHILHCLCGCMFYFMFVFYFVHFSELVVIDGDLVFLIIFDWRRPLPRLVCECLNFKL